MVGSSRATSHRAGSGCDRSPWGNPSPRRVPCRIGTAESPHSLLVPSAYADMARVPPHLTLPMSRTLGTTRPPSAHRPRTGPAPSGPAGAVSSPVARRDTPGRLVAADTALPKRAACASVRKTTRPPWRASASRRGAARSRSHRRRRCRPTLNHLGLPGETGPPKTRPCRVWASSVGPCQVRGTTGRGVVVRPQRDTTGVPPSRRGQRPAPAPRGVATHYAARHCHTCSDGAFPSPGAQPTPSWPSPTPQPERAALGTSPLTPPTSVAVTPCACWHRGQPGRPHPSA
jgi:hypothetical protein